MDHKGEFCKGIRELARRYDRHEVFNDFCEIAAITLRQVFERNQANEERYLKLIRRYEPEEQKQFARLLALTAQALTEKPRDFLGECFHELELHNRYKGQFFTPFDVSRMMAKISLAGFEEQIRKHGYVELNEPTCGSGGMVIAAVEEVKAAGFNPVHVFFAVAQDIDRKCCNMTYIQLSLLAVPAAVIWGDTLILECREQWLTAGYYFGAWPERFRWRRALHAVRELAAAPVAVPDEPEEPPAAPLPAPVPAPLDGPGGQLMFDF